MSYIDDLKEAIGGLMGATATEGGYVLGFAIIIISITAFLIVSDSKQLAMFSGLVGVAIVILLGIWPIWAIIFLVIVLAVILVRLPTFFGASEV